MSFLWNRGILHRHLWKCGKCGFMIEFNTREWAYKEIETHKKLCKKWRTPETLRGGDREGRR